VGAALAILPVEMTHDPSFEALNRKRKTAVLLAPEEVDRVVHTTVGYRAPNK